MSYIKSQFGIDIAKPHFSATKSQIKKREGGAQEEPAPKKREGRPGRQESRPATERKVRAGGESDLIEWLETLKPLIAWYRLEKVHRLIDLLG